MARVVIHNHVARDAFQGYLKSGTATIYQDSRGWHWKPKGKSPNGTPPYPSVEAAKAAARQEGYNAFFVDDF